MEETAEEPQISGLQHWTLAGIAENQFIICDSPQILSLLECQKLTFCFPHSTKCCDTISMILRCLSTILRCFLSSSIIQGTATDLREGRGCIRAISSSTLISSLFQWATTDSIKLPTSYSENFPPLSESIKHLTQINLISPFPSLQKSE